MDVIGMRTAGEAISRQTSTHTRVMGGSAFEVLCLKCNPATAAGTFLQQEN